MPLYLRWLGTTRLPVEVDGVLPASLGNLSTSEIAQIQVPLGNRLCPLGELFEVGGDASDGVLRFEGDLRSVARIGQGLSSGRIDVDGDVGPHLGAGMSCGTIVVRGSTGPWAGAEMRGGRLEIHGKAGRFLGAAYPGSRLGMRDGVILVEGDAGDDVGMAMRRGLIAVSGCVGDNPGHDMVAGTVVIGGSAGQGAGVGMKRGSIVLLQGETPGAILPTFIASGTDRPPFLTIYLSKLRAWGFPVSEAASSARFARYNGDLAAGGQGEIWALARSA
jgi:formylmethanofuran dehydrogenase subunit C